MVPTLDPLVNPFTEWNFRDKDVQVAEHLPFSCHLYLNRYTHRLESAVIKVAVLLIGLQCIVTNLRGFSYIVTVSEMLLFK